MFERSVSRRLRSAPRCGNQGEGEAENEPASRQRDQLSNPSMFARRAGALSRRLAVPTSYRPMSAASIGKEDAEELRDALSPWRGTHAPPLRIKSHGHNILQVKSARPCPYALRIPAIFSAQLQCTGSMLRSSLFSTRDSARNGGRVQPLSPIHKVCTRCNAATRGALPAGRCVTWKLKFLNPRTTLYGHGETRCNTRPSGAPGCCKSPRWPPSL